VKVGVLLAAVAAALLIASCGGKTAVSTPEYLRAIDKVLGDAQQRSPQLPPEESQKYMVDKDFTIKTLSRNIDTLKDMVARLNRLEPPPEAAKDHQALVSNAQALARVYQDIKAKVEAARTPEELQAVKDSLPIPEGVDAGKGFRDACQRLQFLAQDLRLNIDLACNKF
jgi:hypothetical protein